MVGYLTVRCDWYTGELIYFNAFNLIAFNAAFANLYGSILVVYMRELDDTSTIKKVGALRLEVGDFFIVVTETSLTVDEFVSVLLWEIALSLSRGRNLLRFSYDFYSLYVYRFELMLLLNFTNASSSVFRGIWYFARADFLNFSSILA